MPVFSSGGFEEPLTAKYDFSEEIAEGDCPVVVLHIRQYRPERRAHAAGAGRGRGGAFVERALAARSEVAFSR